GRPSAPGPAGRRPVDRVQHGVRALVPASARRGLRKAFGKER
ncbi:MAG: hypothetical protein JWN91_4446, partial [Nocardioides sp.]|nr:hypothetical protein [Nocardioides sp.]